MARDVRRLRRRAFLSVPPIFRPLCEPESNARNRNFHARIDKQTGRILPFKKFPWYNERENDKKLREKGIPMKLLFAHYRVGQTDGVSLEMDKWRRARKHGPHLPVSGRKPLAGDRFRHRRHVLSRRGEPCDRGQCLPRRLHDGRGGTAGACLRGRGRNCAATDTHCPG